MFTNVGRDIRVHTSFVGYHRWPEAPDEVRFLRSDHRHVFHVYVSAPITKDRDIEFFMLQRKVSNIIKRMNCTRIDDECLLGTMSCEHLATIILEQLPEASQVEVYEDNENGSRVWRI